ncbi:MAG: hypothetical protein ABIQ35_11565 [Verrucomicrobiota bacterium]
MFQLQKILTIVLLVAWLPTSSHALLEYAGLIHGHLFDHDSAAPVPHDHDSESHEAADGKFASSSTRVGISRPDFMAMPVLICAQGLDWFSQCYVAATSSLAPSGTAPPQLSHRWQFSFRTALPARAPSLVS